MRRPVRMSCEEAVDEADMEGNKQPEGYADEARHHSEPPIEGCKSLAGVSEWRSNDHRDQHHSGDRSKPKNQKVGNRPAGIPDRCQNQQSDCRRSGKPVYDSHHQRPKKLIHANPLQRRLRRILRQRL